MYLANIVVFLTKVSYTLQKKPCLNVGRKEFPHKSLRLGTHYLRNFSSPVERAFLGLTWLRR